jgi:hypothetical protein
VDAANWAACRYLRADLVDSLRLIASPLAIMPAME